jgi:sugar lactone lactonase YvrE
MIGVLRGIITVELVLAHSRSQTRKEVRHVDAVIEIFAEAVVRAVIPRLFFFELNAGRIHSMNADGSDRKTIVSDCHLPDGIVVDAKAGHIYWTNMGIPSLNDGSVERADIDGKNRKTIVAQGHTHSPKQIILDKKGGKLYWCDREGMRVMRCNLDGTQLETLVEAAWRRALKR